MPDGFQNYPLSPNPYPDRQGMIDYYRGFYPPLVLDFYPVVRAVAEEMDDLAYPMLPRERFDAMTERVMERMRGAGALQIRDHERDWDHDHNHHRRGDLGRGLIAALLIAELLRRRRCCF